ncbi:MAG: DegT/DnrJ/EryC1/StrS family aminotransferase, partial [Proteobacteria bacterium]|nr:DegT/DnrJ/EryC1/StrS family aminotransferase [Pseudomonadota bacterium]
LTDIQAALGIAQLERLDEFNRRRSALVKRYLEGLHGTEGLELPGDPPYPHTHAHHLFVVKIAAMERPLFMEELSAYNIGYGIHFPPCHLLRYVQRRFGVQSLPETERAAGRIVSLPLFPEMTDEDVAYVCACTREILAKVPGSGR